MNLSLDEISNRVVDAVLDERMINKDSLIKRIRPILKIWLKNTDTHKNVSKKPKDKLVHTIEQRGIERDFWKQSLKDIVGDDKMQEYYNIVNQKVKDHNESFCSR